MTAAQGRPAAEDGSPPKTNALIWGHSETHNIVVLVCDGRTFSEELDETNFPPNTQGSRVPVIDLV